MIHNAWHFHYVLRLVFEVVCGSFGIALLAPECGVMPKRSQKSCLKSTHLESRHLKHQ
ncbi:DUF3265 domain-containing protein [Vibrio splendidus]|nr:DUF3265 domain-containing protein [Vibrio splendidus]